MKAFAWSQLDFIPYLLMINLPEIAYLDHEMKEFEADFENTDEVL